MNAHIWTNCRCGLHETNPQTQRLHSQVESGEFTFDRHDTRIAVPDALAGRSVVKCRLGTVLPADSLPFARREAIIVANRGDERLSQERDVQPPDTECRSRP